MISELIQNNPRISMIVISFLVTLFITIVTYFMTDKVRMKELRDKQKRLKEEIKKHRDNPQKMMELNKQMMEDMPEQLRHSFKPMLVTIIPMMLLWTWLKGVYTITPIASTWFWWYLGASLVSSIILRKLFGLQ